MRATFEGILSSINIRYFELNDFPTYTRVISGSGWKPVPIIVCKGTLTVYAFLSSEGLFVFLGRDISFMQRNEYRLPA